MEHLIDFIPSFKCPNTIKNYGGLYTDLKIGLITADEVIFAGAGSDWNESYYLQGKSFYFWTASPDYFDGLINVGIVADRGEVLSVTVDGEWGTRPTINLKSDLLYTSGNGTKISPYLVGWK